MSDLKSKFQELKDSSTKWEKYFSVYEKIFNKYKNKDITFVEIGILNGGSLNLWKNYFGKNSKIIGIDINPECKKFENIKENIQVYIGNQSDVNFWKNFFQEQGKIDVLLDDGGHTNLDQIVTIIETVENIKDGGLIVIEDTHTSYIDDYNSSNKFSFINFSKKIIDNVNSNINLNLGLKFKYDLKDFIYSIEFFESMVCFNIDKSKTYKNQKVFNKGIDHNIQDLTWKGNEIFITKIRNFLRRIPLIRFNRLIKRIKNRVNNNYIKKFFE